MRPGALHGDRELHSCVGGSLASVLVPHDESVRQAPLAVFHAGLSGHRSYVEITTALLTVRPSPANPMYDEQENAT
jgi:hypothetical protein